MKVITVVGARPQFIKASVLTAELARCACTHRLVHTGQHYDYEMSRVFFDGLNLPEPDYYLDVGSASHALQTANMMTRLEPVIAAEHPDLVLVYGDTNSTLAGALVAAKLRVPIGHIEAGLRSHNREMPEEINRVVVDHVADLHFAPTRTAVENLAAEGITGGVHLVGDVMVDLVNQTAEQLPEKPPILKRFDLMPSAFGVLTLHRASNTADTAVISKIIEGLRTLDFPIVFPVHPRTRQLLTDVPGVADISNLRVCEPLPYIDMIALQANARVILTDSGGMQKEALALQVPCVTLRDETEWIETLENGWNVLSGCDPVLIRQNATRAKPMSKPKQYYGEGKTAQRIVSVLLNRFVQREAIA